MSSGIGSPERDSLVVQPAKRVTVQEGWNLLKRHFTAPVKTVKDLFGGDKPASRYDGFSRRKFLKGVTAIALTVAAGGGGIFAIKKYRDESPETKADYNYYPKPEGMPEDVLTKEELDKAGITVYQTANTQLYLRKGIFDLPVFKDAKEKRNGGVVITLVDSSELNWKTVAELPAEPRIIREVFDTHPMYYSEEEWQARQDYYQEIQTYSRETKAYWEKELIKVKSGEEERERRQSLEIFSQVLARDEDESACVTGEDYKKMTKKYYPIFDDDKINDILKMNMDAENISSSEEYVQKHALIARGKIESDKKNLEKRKQDLDDLVSGKSEKELKDSIRFNEEKIQESQSWLEVLGSKDRQKAINRVVEESIGSGDLGQFFHPKQIMESRELPNLMLLRAAGLFRDHPDWMDKTYIFLCVGSEQEPNPADSFPQPDWFGTRSGDKGDSQVDKKRYDVYSKKGYILPGFAIRHETFHYGPGEGNEYVADHGALDSITQAWLNYRQTGSTSGYPFVFVTKEGIAITEKSAADKPA